MEKRRLRPHILFLLVAVIVVIPIITLFMTVSTSLKPKENKEVLLDDIITSDLPVINTTNVINPYLDQSVTIKKGFYDYQESEEKQVDSITYHDNTYMQNTGIDYVSENVFDVVSILEGTVINVKDDDKVGKTVEIKHDNGLISIYQSLSETMVKKNDIVNQGIVLGKSGTNELDKELGNHLHFEIYDNGQPVNPLNYLNREVIKKKEN